MKVIAEFIPIILLFLYLTYSNYFIELTYSTLGKLLMVSIIVFYARINKYLGLLVCLFIIAFYNATNPILCTLRSFQEGVQSMRPLSSEEIELEKTKEQNRADEKRMELDAQKEQNAIIAERNRVLDKQTEHNANCDRLKTLVNKKKPVNDKIAAKMIDDAKKIYSSKCMGITLSDDTAASQTETSQESSDNTQENTTTKIQFKGFKTLSDGFTNKKEEFTTYSEKNEKEFKLLRGINTRK